MFYADSKQEIAKAFMKVNGTCFNSNCLWLFLTWPSFSEVTFNHSFKYFKLLRSPYSWFERQKFRNGNETLSGVCVCVCVCACVSRIPGYIKYSSVHGGIPCDAQWETFSSQQINQFLVAILYRSWKLSFLVMQLYLLILFQ